MGQNPGGTPNFDPSNLPKRDPEELTDTLVTTMLTHNGSLMRKNPKLRPASANDTEALSRLTGQTIEEFNAMLSKKLAGVSDIIINKIMAKLDEDKFKPGELAFLFSVMHDKRQSMEGRAQITNASINIQINNNGTQLSKAELISMLEGRKPVTENVVETTTETVTDLPAGTEPERKVG